MKSKKWLSFEKTFQALQLYPEGPEKMWALLRGKKLIVDVYAPNNALILPAKREVRRFHCAAICAACGFVLRV